MNFADVISYAKNHRTQYMILSALLVVSFAGMVLASIAYDPIRKLEERGDVNALAAAGVSAREMRNAKHAAVLTIVVNVLVLVAVIAMMVMGQRFLGAMQKRLSMRFI